MCPAMSGAGTRRCGRPRRRNEFAEGVSVGTLSGGFHASPIGRYSSGTYGFVVIPEHSAAPQRPQSSRHGLRQVAGFMAELREREGVSAQALEFTIITAARTGETIGAKWREIDLKQKLWTVPAERMKSGREHRVPLSERAVEILEEVPREAGNEFVFIGGRKGRGLSNMAMLELLRGMGHGELTVHG